jgi:CheY-like chemotaxis protein
VTSRPSTAVGETAATGRLSSLPLQSQAGGSGRAGEVASGAAGLEFAAGAAGPAHDEAPGSDQPISALLGVRVLVVEDEMMVALFIEDTLRELGCDVIEPAHTITDARARIEDHEIDAAVLDINIAEDEVYPIADLLASRGVPFVFATGYALESIQEEWRSRPIIRKPYHAEQLRAALENALRDADR